MRWGSAFHSERVDIGAGQTMISGLAFPIPDGAQPSGDLKLCAQSRGQLTEDKCITLPAPSEPWN